MKRFVLAMLAALLLSGAVWAQELDQYGNSKPWMRLWWFYSQRMDANGNIPVNAWLRAWEEAQNIPIYTPLGLTPQSMTWEFFGPDTANVAWATTGESWLARVNSILVHPTNPNILYIGVAKGGVWRSNDGGSTWVNLTDQLPTQYVGCLAMDPVDPNIIYLGTGEEYFAVYTLGGVGIYRSTDGGNTWTLYGNSVFAGGRINEIVIDPSNRNRWFVSTDTGIWVTTNGGSTFTQRLAGVASALRMHPTNPNRLWAAIGWPWGSSRNGVYFSTDGGNTWTRYSALPLGTTVGRIELDVCRANPNVLYVVFGMPGSQSPNDRLHSVWRTTDGGATWTQLTNAPTGSGQQWYNLVMRVDPNDPNVAYLGEIELWRTTDGGNTWTRINGAVPNGHVDQHALAFHPTDTRRIYIGCDGGLFFSTNRGDTRTPLNTGRGTMEYYGFDVHPTDPSRLAAGAQDNGKQVRSTTNTYRITRGADGMQIAYKRTNPSIVLGGIQRGIVDRSTNGGDSWTTVFSPPSGERTLWEAPIVNDAATPNRFYTATQFLYRSTNDGQTWSRVSDVDLTNGAGAVSAIAVAPSNSNVIYTGSSEGVVYVSTDGGSTWTHRSPSRINSGWTGYIHSIAIAPDRPEIAWVSFTGARTTKVVRTTDYGISWSDFTFNLPSTTSVNYLLLNPRQPSMVFAATDTGVFVLRGTTWYRLGIGLPGTPCTMLRVSGNYLYVSTYGRGIWRVDLPEAAFAETEIRLNPSNIPGQIDGIARIEAQLRDVLTGAGVAGKPLRFFVDNALVATVSTNASGVAVHNYRVPSTATAGQRYPVRVVWEGDPTADAAVAEGTITVERIRTRTVASDVSGRWGQQVSLRATVTREDDGRPLQGVSVDFSVGGTWIGSSLTSSTGVALLSYRLNAIGGQRLLAQAGWNDQRHGYSWDEAWVSVTYPVVEGLVRLQDWTGALSQPAVLDIIDRNDPQKYQRFHLQLDTKGGFRVETPIFGKVRASVKVSHWLRQTLLLNVEDVTKVEWKLINGDVDEDNEISLLDFGYLVAAFGTTPNDNGWFANADLDGDKEVSLLDFGILLRNFGLVGDEP
ncbi:MAG: hypothetical protein NZ741_01970 [Armatimonadetes bacterium]|nr:hypothetical protein [Armatimonadota bacterium]